MQRASHTLRLTLLAMLFGVAGCAPMPPDNRRQQADALAAQAGWTAQPIAASPFVLQAYAPQPQKRVRGGTLTVYIEGDGLAWLGPNEVSDDPTPRTPIALQLALRHPGSGAAYLARPCQYVQGENARHCAPRYWTQARFAPEVVQATNQALNTLMQDAEARQLVLVGYSGGGAVAALVAAQRTDVLRLVTVAGNLDHPAWTRWHRVTPLAQSLNPADAWERLLSVPQVHLSGARDTIVPPALALGYVQRYPAGRTPELRVLPDQDHACCWVQIWPELAGKVLP